MIFAWKSQRYVIANKILLTATDTISNIYHSNTLFSCASVRHGSILLKSFQFSFKPPFAVSDLQSEYSTKSPQAFFYGNLHLILSKPFVGNTCF